MLFLLKEQSLTNANVNCVFQRAYTHHRDVGVDVDIDVATALNADVDRYTIHGTN